MAAKKKTKTASKVAPKTKKEIVSKSQQSGIWNFFANMRMGESYTSLILGIIAVIVATVLLLSFFSNRQASKPGAEATPTIVDVKDLDIKITPTEMTPGSDMKKYKVNAGDTLWSISEKNYGSGYNWIDIAKANSLLNPNKILVGAVLSLPFVNLKDATVMTGENEAEVSRTVRIVEQTYTVVAGDNLWSIAVRSYGDGYQWVNIAKANNLSNPDLIYPGNVLKIPLK